MLGIEFQRSLQFGNRCLLIRNRQRESVGVMQISIPGILRNQVFIKLSTLFHMLSIDLPSRLASLHDQFVIGGGNFVRKNRHPQYD